jgi:Flp pilus assembly protein TadG
MTRPGRASRRGAAAVEAAVVYPVLMLLLFGLIVGGLGVFRYQQVALLAREGARAASVRGSRWEKETAQPSPTQRQLSDQVKALAAGMDPALLTVQVDWVDVAGGTVTPWDSASKKTTSPAANGDPVANHVRVTVTYQWVPELFLAGPLTFRSVSEVPQTY